MIKNILFDLDGTLIDSLDVWDEVDDLFLKRRGLQLTKEYKDTINNLHFDAAAIFTIEYYQLNETKQQLIDEWLELAKTQYTYHVGLLDGVMDVLDILKEKGFNLYIVTSCMEELYIPCLNRLNIYSYFTQIVDTQQIPIKKGNPQFYEVVLAKLNLNSSECLFMDDILENVEAAKNAGITSLLVSKDEPISQLLEYIKL